MSEDYVHRIGRSGRAGEEGVALSLVSPDEAKLMRDIERLLKKQISVLAKPMFEPKKLAPAPKPQSPQGRKSGSGRPRRAKPGTGRTRRSGADAPSARSRPRATR